MLAMSFILIRWRVYTCKKPSSWTLKAHVNCTLMVYWLNSLPTLKLILSELVNGGKPVLEARALGQHCHLVEKNRTDHGSHALEGNGGVKKAPTCFRSHLLIFLPIASCT